MKLLRAFSAKKGKILTRFELFQIGWDLDHLPNSRTLDQHIALLRKKIEEDTKSSQTHPDGSGSGLPLPLRIRGLGESWGKIENQVKGSLRTGGDTLGIGEPVIHLPKNIPFPSPGIYAPMQVNQGTIDNQL
jgi:hypothetical protein